MNMSSDYKRAWETVNEFVNECKNSHSQHAVAIILTGSLARGSYQPGLSDIDLITVLRNGTPDDVKTGISDLYGRLSRSHSVQLEPIILGYQDFWPPWNDDLCIPPELLRLKASGRVLYGDDSIIGQLPTPTKRQMWEFELSMKRWAAKSKRLTNWRSWTLKNSLKTILGQATSYFYYKTGIFEYSKHHIADLFSHQFPGFPYLFSLRLASYLWRHYPGDENEELRLEMAEQAKEFENYVTLALGFGERYLIR